MMWLLFKLSSIQNGMDSSIIVGWKKVRYRTQKYEKKESFCNNGSIWCFGAGMRVCLDMFILFHMVGRTNISDKRGWKEYVIPIEKFDRKWVYRDMRMILGFTHILPQWKTFCIWSNVIISGIWITIWNCEKNRWMLHSTVQFLQQKKLLVLNTILNGKFLPGLEWWVKKENAQKCTRNLL